MIEDYIALKNHFDIGTLCGKIYIYIKGCFLKSSVTSATTHKNRLFDKIKKRIYT